MPHTERSTLARRRPARAQPAPTAPRARRPFVRPFAAPHQRPAAAAGATRAGDAAAPLGLGLPLRRQQQRAAPPRAAVVASAATLAELPLVSIINTSGLVQPEVPASAEACVLAIFDDNQKLQYVGFSKDLRNTLRTLLSRRPDKAYYFKAEHLQAVDQAAMMAIRDAWFAEVRGLGRSHRARAASSQQPAASRSRSRRARAGRWALPGVVRICECGAAWGQPPAAPRPTPAAARQPAGPPALPRPAAQVGGPPLGNKLALERSAWQQPIEAFAISERGKQAAAEEAVKTQQLALKERGCREDFLPNPELLLLGKVSCRCCWARCARSALLGQRRVPGAQLPAPARRPGILVSPPRRPWPCPWPRPWPRPRLTTHPTQTLAPRLTSWHPRRSRPRSWRRSSAGCRRPPGARRSARWSSTVSARPRSRCAAPGRPATLGRCSSPGAGRRAAPLPPR
jgi:hypothetical protein